MKKLKLSEKQIEVIKYMRIGYELGKRTGFQGSRSWIQKGGCGSGGECIDIMSKTFQSIIDKRLVQLKKEQESFNQPQLYELTDLGKNSELKK